MSVGERRQEPRLGAHVHRHPLEGERCRLRRLRKDFENTEWNMVGGVDEANNLLCKKINVVAGSRMGKNKTGKDGKAM